MKALSVKHESQLEGWHTLKVTKLQKITTCSWTTAILQGMESKISCWSRPTIATCFHGAKSIKVASRPCFEGEAKFIWPVENYVVMYGICGSLTKWKRWRKHDFYKLKNIDVNQQVASQFLMKVHFFLGKSLGLCNWVSIKHCRQNKLLKTSLLWILMFW